MITMTIPTTTAPAPQKTLSQAEVLENIRRTNAQKNYRRMKRMNTALPQDFRLSDLRA